ncbi:MAG: FAD-dependent thymidylate synthase, partial [Candidatus Omnitrophica bacterium]|nr:FAD-dependent thymidylate synthase [Candidatus Omnitrophota bacterium]
MEINIAGYNIDTEHINTLQQKSGESLTPEIISASYARISRDPRPIDEIRNDAREAVDKARRSNEQIVFGMGHSSIAEHAVYNIDILRISRLLIEEIQRSRLVSYTEKSQRYITLEDDFVIPAEIKDSGLEKQFTAIIKEQNALYHELFEALIPYVVERYKNTIFDKKNVLEGLAKEDARYIVALATEAQLGMTINARNLEGMLMRLFALELQEGRNCAELLHKKVKDITPSLIKYVEPTEYRRTARNVVRYHAKHSLSPEGKGEDVTLVHATNNGDDIVLTSLLYTTSHSAYESCLKDIKNMRGDRKEELFKSVFEHIEQYDQVLREFENIDYTFELEISATCFAQLKRHRMATIHTQPYDPALGVVVPESIIEVGLDKKFRAVIEKTNALYETIKEKSGEMAAAYCLTNAHKRRVLMKLNARSLYHLSRLREDAHA